MQLQKYILHITIIDCTRFMALSLSKLANSLSEGIHRIKCKLRHDDKKYETCRIKCKYYNVLGYNCLCWNINYQHEIDKTL